MAVTVWRAVALVLLAAGAGCAHPGQARDAVQVIESGIEIDRRSPVYWVSSDELLFSAPTDEFVMQGSFRKPVSKLTVWNFRTKKITRLAAADGGLCYYEGNLAYWESDNSARRQWTSLGRLRGPMTREERGIRYDGTTCLPYEALPQPPARSEEHVFVRLRPEHGFIDMGAQLSTANTPMRLYKPGSLEGIELPLKRREIQRATIRFFPFKGAYFIESVYFDPSRGYEIAPWPERLVRPVWWLYPDGKVEEILVPPSIWMRERIVPSKVGLAAISNGFFTITGAPPYDGAYLVDGKGGRRLIRGVFDAADLSSDGCRLAVHRQPEPGLRRPEYWTLTVLALCQEAR